MSLDAAPPLRRARSTSRSRSPMLALTSAAITSKVIKRLEGLTHLEMLGVTSIPEDDTEDIPSSNVSDTEREKDDDEALEAERLVLVVDEHEVTPQPTVDAKKEKKKVDWEVPRKLLHSSIGFFTLYLYVTEGDVSKVVLTLWSSLCIIVPADAFRLRWPTFERLYERLLGFLMRESEKKSTNGVIWYILGVNFALQFYPRDVATVAILILSWADTAASTIGRLYGPSSPRLPSSIPLLPPPLSSLPLLCHLRLPLAPRKSVAGFMAASFTGTCIAIAFWAWIAPMRFGGKELVWSFEKGVTGTGTLSGWLGLSIVGLVAGLISGVAEAMDLGSLDDNLTLPIVSGGCILGFLKFASWIGSIWT
ncbi:hypothetical protein AGABI1DRAFT_116813 [Agaricus bisporus var. burnettii JB137-S8]|uniref:Dolichol kinase n=1 Tax=Agaricus bisporus var. burnettii (strain JB137-S8 / ATCC MYA-4627 / FGSC 10392) TaxID=597362 RepID=K5XJI8_AGABU|nr:uncharacterized protein AGABI1DRAFT_116813 [Agaricus bisporus var. burnettii JB137-S8]EKM74635.1 hypothetical protein AGABI1DRAFT_116813 [Agaricus bisporus var. burnettii JB137-S8]